MTTTYLFIRNDANVRIACYREAGEGDEPSHDVLTVGDVVIFPSRQQLVQIRDEIIRHLKAHL